MTKPIMFEPYTWQPTGYNEKILISRGNNLWLAEYDHADRSQCIATTASQACAVAAKLYEWASAVEDNKCVTFKELAVKEWFCVNGNIEHPCVKVTEHRYTSPYADADVCPDPNMPVTRMRAAFEEIK